MTRRVRYARLIYELQHTPIQRNIRKNTDIAAKREITKHSIQIQFQSDYAFCVYIYICVCSFFLWSREDFFRCPPLRSPFSL